MNITKLRPVRILPNAKDKIFYDFFPDLFALQDFSSNGEQGFDEKHSPLHAGAWCLYATLLLTRIHETDTLSLNPYFKERKTAQLALIKNDAKNANMTDTETENLFIEITKRDIRNCIAHGDFTISYDIYTKKLYFVLSPTKTEYPTPEPIVISKVDIINAIKDKLYKISQEYRIQAMSEFILNKMATDGLSNSLQEFLLPTTMMQLAEHYLNNKYIAKEEIPDLQKKYHYIQYVLLLSKITYEQQDYYDIFKKTPNNSSRIFDDTIRLLRNALSHGNYEFVDEAKSIRHTDKRQNTTQSIDEVCIKLLTIDAQKELIKQLMTDGNRSTENIEGIAQQFEEAFNILFFNGQYSYKEILNEAFDKEPTEKE